MKLGLPSRICFVFAGTIHTKRVGIPKKSLNKKIGTPSKRLIKKDRSLKKTLNKKAGTIYLPAISLQITRSDLKLVSRFV